jgi:ubiquinone/menaquinone biosynthesis C-methylase UbiE
MLEVARQKPVPEGSASIEWFEADISDLCPLSSIQKTVDEGGFDLITCCSSFGYLPDRAGAVRHWLSLLKPGGRLICDVPTEDVTLQYVSGTSFRDITGIGVPFDRKWVKSIHSLEELLQSEGYSIEKSLKTKSYILERWLSKEELEEIFEKQLIQVADQKTKETWRAFFQTLMLNNEGQLKNSYAVYITIGVKQAVAALAT